MQVRILLLLMLSLAGHMKLLRPSLRHASSDYWFNHLSETGQVSRLFYMLYWPSTTGRTKSYLLFNRFFRIYFLKKEVFYTKLKYSRVPQFDTSAGASASFLSGLYGFMICEKFGFELLDSGDFLFLVLYLFWFFLVGVTYVQLFNYPTSLARDFYNLCRSFFSK